MDLNEKTKLYELLFITYFRITKKQCEIKYNLIPSDLYKKFPNNLYNNFISQSSLLVNIGDIVKKNNYKYNHGDIS